MKVRKRGLLGGIAAVAAAAAIMVPSAAFAQGGPPAGRGHGGGEETATNNLSVPTIMVNGGFAGVTCGTADTPRDLVTPSGEPQTGFPIDPAAYYYVQGVNTWQAQCYNAATASATAAWGDNLTGDAKLSVGSPIRVELGLYNAGTSPDMQGYTVVKLDPNALDRESAYGTLATGSPTTGFSATPTTFTATQQRVYDAGVTFSIKNDTTGSYVVPEGTSATAEINATGNVVYGYNLRVSSAGPYTITFTVPTVTITGTDAGTYTDHSVTLPINVTSGRGGGGGVGRGGGAGGGGGHHGGR